jgi:diguanylate cyclase (GGDEF)-like protein
MRVVLVAASRLLTERLTALLETRGHDVTCFVRANDALDHLATHEDANAIVIVDSGEDTAGSEICWEARLVSSFERPIYICLISRPLSSRAFIEALDCGADDVLQLPLSPDELYARLRAAERFTQMQFKLVEMATRDGLTGLLNRPAFFNRAAKLCDDCDAPLAAIMVDIDHFKTVNDSYGHAAGDRAIQAVAACLLKHEGVAARLGGEEFALLLKGGDAGDAWRAAEALRRRIAMLEIDVESGCLRLSCSFGVAMGAPREDIDEILRKADAALCAAKRSGRNMVALYEAEKGAMPNRPNGIIRGGAQTAGGVRRPIAV